MMTKQSVWQKFKTQKRAFFSLVLFVFIFVVSLLSPFIANDKPLLLYYKGNFLFPMFENYTDEFLGGSLPTYADYKDSFTRKQIKDNGFMVMPVIEFSFDTINYDLKQPAPNPPSFKNWLGTDDQGRDVLARLLYGIRISLLFGLFLTFFSSIIGIFMGAIQGYFGGKVDLFLQRFLEIWGAMPQMFVLIIVSSILLPSFWTLLLILLLFSWTGLVGVVRAEFLRARNFDYVKSAKALGVSDMRIILRHILPNALVACVTYIPFILSGSIVALTALDFLGFGMPAGSPSLGELVRQGKENLNAPWLGISAFLSTSILLVCLIFIGEGFRNAFDPRQKVTSKGEKKLIVQDISNKLLSVRHLTISFGHHKIVEDINFDIEKGQTVALIGASGCGKSMTALSILGLSDATVKGSIQLSGLELVSSPENVLCKIRGRKIGLVFQEPMTALNPLHKVKKQIAEVMQIHFKKASTKRIYELLGLVGLKQEKNRILNSYIHQLSGGQRQRVLIAMALAGEPDLLIADEPTTALDVVLQKQVLDLLKSLQEKLGLSILFISHDKNVVSYMTKNIYELKDKKIQPVQISKTFPKIGKVDVEFEENALKVQDLTVSYGDFKALNSVSFDLFAGQTLAVVGTSGSGKTTLGMALLRLIKATGKAFVDNQDVMSVNIKQFNQLRKDIQIVFQDPFSSLNPRMTVSEIITEGLNVFYSDLSKKEKHARVLSVLKAVDLSEDVSMRYPHELSGGQRQRIAIARALILEPKILILDEPTSALDEKNRQTILTLLNKIQKNTNVSFLLITHDMNVVRQMADTVLVLKDGSVVEYGKVQEVLFNPQEEYTKILLNSAFLS